MRTRLEKGPGWKTDNIIDQLQVHIYLPYMGILKLRRDGQAEQVKK